jgi:hypothetical protein
MPNELLRSLKINKDLFAATDLRQQLVFASVDLETHAMGDDDGEIKITHESIRDIAARLSEEGFFPNGAGSGAEKKKRQRRARLRVGTSVRARRGVRFDVLLVRLRAAHRGFDLGKTLREWCARTRRGSPFDRVFV